jgi:hypothetical protein
MSSIKRTCAVWKKIVRLGEGLAKIMGGHTFCREEDLSRELLLEYLKSVNVYYYSSGSLPAARWTKFLHRSLYLPILRSLHLFQKPPPMPL